MGKKCPTDEEIKDAAASFKKASHYTCQYLHTDDVKKENIPYQESYWENNANTLYINMRLLGLSDEIWVNERLKCGFSNQQTIHCQTDRSPTHHIIPVCLSSRVNKILEPKGFNININDGRNGIILPPTKDSKINFAQGVAHETIHNDNKVYNNYIITMIANVSTESELWEALNPIKKQLYDGTFQL